MDLTKLIPELGNCVAVFDDISHRNFDHFPIRALEPSVYLGFNNQFNVKIELRLTKNWPIENHLLKLAGSWMGIKRRRLKWDVKGQKSTRIDQIGTINQPKTDPRPNSSQSKSHSKICRNWWLKLTENSSQTTKIGDWNRSKMELIRWNWLKNVQKPIKTSQKLVLNWMKKAKDRPELTKLTKLTQNWSLKTNIDRLKWMSKVGVSMFN